MSRPLRIIDLGGTVRFWRGWGLTTTDNLEINNHHVDKTAEDDIAFAPFIRELRIDATMLQETFLATFDIIFSNSFIEHLTSWEEQVTLAHRIVRTGRPYFIQTPNKYSLVDPHFPLIPFFGALPRKVQAQLLVLGGWGSGRKEVCAEEAMRRLTFYSPLSRSDVVEMFPSAMTMIERHIGFFPMSILAYSKS